MCPPFEPNSSDPEAAETDPSSSRSSKAAGRVHAALFSQHNFDALYNCTAGECEFERLPLGRNSTEYKDGEVAGEVESHIVAYSALHSHAVYPKANPSTIVCGQIRTFHGEHDGLFFVDRVGKGGQQQEGGEAGGGSLSRRWLPSAEGLLLLPPPMALSPHQPQPPHFNLSRDMASPPLPPEPQEGRLLEEHEGHDLLDESRSWALYPGWWGARKEDTPQPFSLVCLYDKREKREGGTTALCHFLESLRRNTLPRLSSRHP